MQQGWDKQFYEWSGVLRIIKYLERNISVAPLIVFQPQRIATSLLHPHIMVGHTSVKCPKFPFSPTTLDMGFKLVTIPSSSITLKPRNIL